MKKIHESEPIYIENDGSAVEVWESFKCESKEERLLVHLANNTELLELLGYDDNNLNENVNNICHDIEVSGNYVTVITKVFWAVD